ncbi:hypothetical protein MHTCC0001_19690 [Flavobacteriaceae bacterium MHTCC 0001]
MFGDDLVLQDVEEGFNQLKALADDKDCAEAQFQLGYLYYSSDYDYRLSDNEVLQNIHKVFNNKQAAFDYLSKAVAQGHVRALSYLGDLYRKGFACKLSYDKALELYEHAYTLGDQKAGYDIGYCYFKGLGSVDQDYTQAVSWFEKSDYPMAKHWLAICYFYGYGVAVDKAKALDLLSQSKGNLNSPTLLAHLETVYANAPEGVLTPVDELAEAEEKAQLDDIVEADAYSYDKEVKELPLNIKTLKGDWQGHLVDLDYSGEKIMRRFPASFTFKKDGKTGRTAYTSVIDSTENKGVAVTLDNSLYFKDFKISLPRLYKDHPKIAEFDYEILSADIALKLIDGVPYFTAAIDTKNVTTGEPGAPKLLVLINTKLVTENGVEIPVELLEQLLEEQGDNFITLYPNPFVDDLLIQYELGTNATTSVDIYSLDMSFNQSILNSAPQTMGKKVYHYDGRALKKGLYVVRVTTNGVAHTKLIAKN